MRRFSAAHLSNPQVKQRLMVKVVEDRANETEILVLIGEADARKIYIDEGYTSMYAWCIEFFHFSKEVAFRRIHVARMARQYPLLFAAVEDGRLHLSAVRLIAPHLTPENVEEIVARATHRTCEEIEEMLARRVVRLETLLEGSIPSRHLPQAPSSPAPTSPAPSSPAPTSSEMALMIPPLAVRPVMSSSAPAPEAVSVSAVAPAPEPRVSIALEHRVHQKLQYARALLSHSIPLGSDSQVIERALDELIAKVERVKYGAVKRPRQPKPSKLRRRTIPAHVRRSVRERDGDQCTSTSENGQRCAARDALEFDHIQPVARGGKSTVENVRLLCRGHNQNEAEKSLGAEFMHKKRAEAAARRSRRKSQERERSAIELTGQATPGVTESPESLRLTRLGDVVRGDDVRADLGGGADARPKAPESSPESTS
jgi:5-methylcytosine-specific restriction endonuclease McrA